MSDGMVFSYRSTCTIEEERLQRVCTTQSLQEFLAKELISCPCFSSENKYFQILASAHVLLYSSLTNLYVLFKRIAHFRILVHSDYAALPETFEM